MTLPTFIRTRDEAMGALLAVLSATREMEVRLRDFNKEKVSRGTDFEDLERFLESIHSEFEAVETDTSDPIASLKASAQRFTEAYDISIECIEGNIDWHQRCIDDLDELTETIQEKNIPKLVRLLKRHIAAMENSTWFKMMDAKIEDVLGKAKANRSRKIRNRDIRLLKLFLEAIEDS